MPRPKKPTPPDPPPPPTDPQAPIKFSKAPKGMRAPTPIPLPAVALSKEHRLYVEDAFLDAIVDMRNTLRRRLGAPLERLQIFRILCSLLDVRTLVGTGLAKFTPEGVAELTGTPIEPKTPPSSKAAASLVELLRQFGEKAAREALDEAFPPKAEAHVDLAELEGL